VGFGRWRLIIIFPGDDNRVPGICTSSMDISGDSANFQRAIVQIDDNFEPIEPLFEFGSIYSVMSIVNSFKNDIGGRCMARSIHEFFGFFVFRLSI
jgi:hypothetical protein